MKHLIDAGVDAHMVMAFSGHRTASMLKRYHIIDLDDLRRAAERTSGYSGRQASVTPLRGENSHTLATHETETTGAA